MNSAQIQGIVRWVITILGGVAGGGWIAKNMSADEISVLVNQISAVIGALAALASLGWSVYSNHKSQLASQLAKSKDSK